MKWNDFSQNIVCSYKELRNNCDFSDVTLLCEDTQQIDAHRIILAASSPFFRSVLKRNQKSHQMIYMRGINNKDLVAILDFIYHGEVNINQEDLNGFLALAEQLQLKGLAVSQSEKEDKTQRPPTIKENVFHQNLTFHDEANHEYDNNKFTSNIIANIHEFPTLAIPSLIQPKLELEMEEVLGNFHDTKVDGGKKEVLDNLEDTMMLDEDKFELQSNLHHCNLVNIGRKKLLDNTSDDKVLNGRELKVFDDFHDTDMVDEGDLEDDMDKKEARQHSKGRGPDLDWELAGEYNNKEEFEFSGWKEELRSCSLRSGKYTNIETYYCKYDRKKGYSNCAVKIRLKFAESSDHIYVETVGGEHRHEMDRPEDLNSLRWTETQTKVLMTALRNDATPNIIRQKLMGEFPEGKFPTSEQLANKTAHCRKVMNWSKSSLKGTET